MLDLNKEQNQKYIELSLEIWKLQSELDNENIWQLYIAHESEYNNYLYVGAVDTTKLTTETFNLSTLEKEIYKNVLQLHWSDYAEGWLHYEIRKFKYDEVIFSGYYYNDSNED